MKKRDDYQTISADDVFNSIPKARQKKINKNAEEGIKAHYALQDLRNDLDYTQTDIAGSMGVNQVAISNLEKRSDIKLSTLKKYVEAMGGELIISAKFAGDDLRVIQTSPE